MANDHGTAVLSIAGDADIHTIAKIHAQILGEMQQHHSVVLNTDKLESVDLTCVQLIESARRSAIKAGTAVRLLNGATGALRQTLQRGGFLENAADRAFWLNNVVSA